MNQMTAVEVLDPTDRYTITGQGYSLEGTVQHAAGNSNTIEAAILPYIIANDAKIVGDKVVGDPTEGALLVLGHKVGLDTAETQAAYPRLATLPFDPTYKLMAVFCSAKNAAGQPIVRIFVKGAGPAVIGHATTALAKGESVPWDQAAGDRADKAMSDLGARGLRVMAAAIKDIDAATFDPAGDLLSLVTDLQMTSLVGMVDPPRKESMDAVRAAQSANIRVRMVTGDDVVTGAAVAEQLGIPGESILGTEFAALSEEERLRRIDDIGVVGRVAPEHKVLLVETLRKKGDVVAMTGDGVNDAPAIKAADIGVAMGSGTQVAKNAARMILTDDNFATIVRAVSEGRKLYDNMLKYIRFMLVALVAYIVTFLMATILNIAGGQPFSAVQILWINFAITAGVGIMLGLDQETPGLMQRQPRPRDASIMTRTLLVTILLAGGFIAVACNGLIVYSNNQYGDVGIGTTMALVAFSLCLLVVALESRDVRGTVLRMETLDNRSLNIAIGVEVILAVLIARGGVLGGFLGTTPLAQEQWLLAAASAVALFLLWELGKLVVRRRSPGASDATSPAVPAAAAA